MRKLSEAELLSLTNILTIERNGLAVSRAMEPIVTDDDMKKQVQSGILATESRINGIEQFITENRITGEGR